MTLYVYIYLAITFLILFVCAGYFMYIYKSLDRSFQWLAIFSFIQPLLVLTSTYFALKGINNYVFIHIIKHLEFLFIAAAFYHYFKGNHIIKNSLLVISLFYIIFSILDTIFLEPITIAPSHINVVANVIYILFSLAIFYKLYQTPTLLYIEKQAYFWLSASLLCYFGSTIFMTLFFNYLALDLPLSVFSFFEVIDLAIFLISKIFLLYGAYILVQNQKSTLKLVQE